MSAPNRIEIDDELRGDSIICKRGIETDFWRLVKREGEKLQAKAMSDLVVTDPTDVGTISQLQQIAKVIPLFIGMIEDTANLT